MKNQTQIPDSIRQIFPNAIRPNFEHRLSATGFDTPLDLVLLMQFSDSAQSRLSDSVMIGLVDAAIQEVNDIQSTVTAFAESK